MMATPIAFVMLKEARAPDKEALLAALRRRHPGLRWERGPDARDAKPDTPVVIRAGDHLLAILLMPVPLPYDQGIWQRASWMWPDAFHAADQHRAYLVVATFDSTGGMAGADLSAVESSRLATALIGGVLETLPGGLGVVWRGKVAGSAEAWVEQSPRAFEPFPDHPYRLWMEIVPFLSGATIGAYTVGLSAFIGREIEFEVDGLDEQGVVVRVANASSYL